MKLCMAAGFFKKNCPMNEENRPGSLNLLKNGKMWSFFFFWIWSIKKVYTICYIPVQIPYLGKMWFLRYGPKCSLPIRLQNFYINCIFRIKWWNSVFFAWWYKFMEIEIWLKSIWVSMLEEWVWLFLSQDSKSGCTLRMIIK